MTFGDLHYQRALVRANEHCERCGKPKVYGDLGVHHIKAYQLCKTDAEANSPKNLIVLCRSCHSKVHRLGEIAPHQSDGKFARGKREVMPGGDIALQK